MSLFLSNETPLKDVLVGRFKSLWKPDFEGITLGDLRQMDTYDFVDEFTNHRLLAKAFIQAVVKVREDEQEEYKSGIFYENMFRGQVSSISDRGFSLSDVKKYVANTVPIDLDLSNNLLMDRDVIDILDIAKYENVKVIRLRNCRLVGYTGITRDFITEILSNVEYLDICGNPLIEYSSDFFRSLPSDLLSRLIFVRKSWFQGVGWCKNIDAKEKDNVISSHQRFYSTLAIT